MATPDLVHCDACGAQVEPRALRCRECGVPFAGAEAARQVVPTVSIEEGSGESFVPGQGMSFRLQEVFPVGDDPLALLGKIEEALGQVIEAGLDDEHTRTRLLRIRDAATTLLQMIE